MKSKPRTRISAWTIFDPIYEVELILLCGPYALAGPWLLKKLGPGYDEPFSPEQDEPQGRTAMVEGDHGTGLVLWLSTFGPKDPASIGLLSHECFHATSMALSHRGVILDSLQDPGGAESFAYHLGFLVRECYARLIRPSR